MSIAETIPGFENQVLVNPERLRQLEEVHKERLTENIPLTKAARLAAKEEAILMSDMIPPGLKEALVKPLSNEKKMWTKVIRQPMGFGPTPEDDHDVEAEAYAQGPSQSMLTQLIQKKKKTPETPSTTTPSGPAPPKVRKRLRFVTQPKTGPKKKKKKVSPRKTTTPSIDCGELPFRQDPTMMGDSITDYANATAQSVKIKIRKKAGRRRLTEADKLRRSPGWLDFDKKLK